MKRIIIVLGIAGMYWLANVVVGLLEFQTSGLFGLFPKPGHGLANGIARALEFPLITLFEKSGYFSNAWLLPATILNSLVWGLAIYLAVAFVLKPGRSNS